ncbi:hypothetical protein N431DRAFT_103367 [Stipitochalara longipes BDJ]|nr:hypothetical protein N431DRAFT_103367 [Stipitochalara longipes BDJ]
MASNRTRTSQFFFLWTTLGLSYVLATLVTSALSLPNNTYTSASTCLSRGFFLISALASVARRKATIMASLSGCAIPNLLVWDIQATHRVGSPVLLTSTYSGKNREKPYLAKNRLSQNTNDNQGGEQSF